MKGDADYIRDRLVRAGLMDDDTGATRSARAVRCPKCRRAIFQGIGADWGGYVVQADPEPLSPLGEALALLSGRATVELRWLGDRYELDCRDHFRITGTPAGTNGIDILVRHDCALANGPPLPMIESHLRDLIETAPLPINPPY